MLTAWTNSFNSKTLPTILLSHSPSDFLGASGATTAGTAAHQLTLHEKGAQTGDDTLCGAQVGSTHAAAIEDA